MTAVGVTKQVLARSTMYEDGLILSLDGLLSSTNATCRKAKLKNTCAMPASLSISASEQPKQGRAMPSAGADQIPHLTTFSRSRHPTVLLCTDDSKQRRNRLLASSLLRRACQHKPPLHHRVLHACLTVLLDSDRQTADFTASSMRSTAER
ncbi:uncharacterized protein UDID_20614 [Ustilago sp. UG-2017a]|nr:uncharacterized protein UDID_20614 [Ustilago sp. UG-2017a]